MEQDHKCSRCSEIKCINLYHESDEEDAGGELATYAQLEKEIEKKKLDDIVCTPGRMLQICCFLTNTASEISNKSQYLLEPLLHASRDLKASLFLAFCGHYRQAMQILRCSLETILWALYFHTDAMLTEDEEQQTRVKKDYEKWKKGGITKRIDVFVEMLRRSGFLSPNEEKKWKQLYGELSKFIHSPRIYPCPIPLNKEIVKKSEKESGLINYKISDCIAATQFEEEQLRAWSKKSGEIVCALVKSLVYFIPAILETEVGCYISQLIDGIEEAHENLEYVKDLQKIVSWDIEIEEISREEFIKYRPDKQYKTLILLLWEEWNWETGAFRSSLERLLSNKTGGFRWADDGRVVAYCLELKEFLKLNEVLKIVPDPSEIDSTTIIPIIDGKLVDFDLQDSNSEYEVITSEFLNHMLIEHL